LFRNKSEKAKKKMGKGAGKKKRLEPKNVPCTFSNHFWFIVFQQSQQQVQAAAGKCVQREVGEGVREE